MTATGALRDESQLGYGPAVSRIRYVHEILFSLNLGFSIVSAIVLRFSSIVYIPFARLAQMINIQLGNRVDDAAGGYVACFAYVSGATIVVFCLLRLFARKAIVLYFLRSAAGIAAIVAAPASWFYIVRWYGWLPLEVAFFLVCTLLYMSNHWSIPVWVNLFLLGIHFGFWGLRFWEYTHNPAEVLMSFIGFCSFIAWAAYLKYIFKSDGQSGAQRGLHSGRKWGF